MKLKVPDRPAIEVELEALYHGQAFIKINAGGDYIMLAANRSEMIGELKRLLRALEVQTIEQVRQAQALPIELYKAETAWPWLLDRFPWIFDGIRTQSEPYASYLKAAMGPELGSCAVCGEVVMAVTAKYCSPACKQAAYRERKAA
jgi:hypothetical protein